MFKRISQVMILIGFLAAGLFLNGCEKKAEEKGNGSPTAVKTPGTAKNLAGSKSFWTGAPGPNPRFYEVEQKLDTGGDLYMYQNAETFGREALDQMKRMLASAPSGDGETSAVLAALDVARKWGLETVQGVGMSAARKDDLYRTKMFLQAKTNEGIFKALGGAPHAPNALNYATSGTLLFWQADLNPTEGFALIRDAVRQVSPNEGAVEWEKGMAEAKTKLGLDVETLLATLGPEFAFAATLDPTEKIRTPDGITIAAPRFALLVQAKDATLLDVLMKRIKEDNVMETTRETVDGVTKCRLHVPPNPQFPMTPVIAFDGQYFIFASHEPYLEALLAAKKSGAGLSSQQEFKALTKDLPKDCNGMLFVAKGVGDTIDALIRGAVSRSGQPMNPEVLVRFLVPGLRGMALVRVNLPDGIWIVCNQAGEEAGSLISCSAAASTFLSSGGAPAVAAVLVAIAVPNFLEAKQRAEMTRAQGSVPPQQEEGAQPATEQGDAQVSDYTYDPSNGATGPDGWRVKQ